MASKASEEGNLSMSPKQRARQQAVECEDCVQVETRYDHLPFLRLMLSNPMITDDKGWRRILLRCSGHGGFPEKKDGRCEILVCSL